MKSYWSHQRFDASCIDPLLRLADLPATVKCKMTELLASNLVILHLTVADKSASLNISTTQLKKPGHKQKRKL